MCVAIGRHPDSGALPRPLLAALAAALLLLPSCARPKPADPTIFRAEVAEAEGETDSDAADPAAAQPKPQPRQEEPLTWISSEKEAAARSKAERRPLLVHFSTDWCADCKRMAAETFTDPRVTAKAGRFVAVRIEATNDEDPQVGAALSKYSVVNVPTLILLDSTGREQKRFTEFVPADTLLGEIEQVR
jgi:thiol:disulfide interchange protein